MRACLVYLKIGSTGPVQGLALDKDFSSIMACVTNCGVIDDTVVTPLCKGGWRLEPRLPEVSIATFWYPFARISISGSGGVNTINY